jgi:hypothetical protein
MRSEQYEQFNYTDDSTALPNPCYEGLPSSASSTRPIASKPSLTGFLAFGVAWLFGLEALLSEDEN